MRKEGGVDLDRCGKKVLGIRFALGIEKQGKSAPSSEAFVEEKIKGEQVGDFESLDITLAKPTKSLLDEGGGEDVEHP